MKQQFSYSEYYAFTHNRTKYFQEYIKGVKEPPNEKMKLGSAIHEWLDDPKYDIIKVLKEDFKIRGKRLLAIRKMLDKAWAKRLSESEVSIIGTMKDGTKLLAKIDTIDRKERIMADWKTTDESKRQQWWVDRDEQLSFYAFVYKLAYHKFLKEIQLYELNTIKGTCKTFYTARGYLDLKDIEQKIQRCIAEIKRLGWWELRKSRAERDKINQKELL